MCICSDESIILFVVHCLLLEGLVCLCEYIKIISRVHESVSVAFSLKPYWMYLLASIGWSKHVHNIIHGDSSHMHTFTWCTPIRWPNVLVMCALLTKTVFFICMHRLWSDSIICTGRTNLQQHNACTLEFTVHILIIIIHDNKHCVCERIFNKI